MYSDVGDTTSLVPGFPIRTSSDQCSVDSSPRHNAASHVLHRLPVPRHPPCALKHLQHKKPIRKKKLHINTQTTPDPYGTDANICVLDARNHYPQIKHHTPPPKWSNNTPPTPHRGQGTAGLLSQSPIVCLAKFSLPASPPQLKFVVHQNLKPTTGQAHPTNRCTHRTPTRCGRGAVSWCSLERR